MRVAVMSRLSRGGKAVPIPIRCCLTAKERPEPVTRKDVTGAKMHILDLAGAVEPYRVGLDFVRPPIMEGA